MGRPISKCSYCGKMFRNSRYKPLHLERCQVYQCAQVINKMTSQIVKDLVMSCISDILMCAIAKKHRSRVFFAEDEVNAIPLLDARILLYGLINWDENEVIKCFYANNMPRWFENSAFWGHNIEPELALILAKRN